MYVCMHVYDICTDIYTLRRTHLHIQELRKDMDSVGSRVKAMRKRAAKLYTKKQQVFVFLVFLSVLVCAQGRGADAGGQHCLAIGCFI